MCFIILWSLATKSGRIITNCISNCRVYLKLSFEPPKKSGIKCLYDFSLFCAFLQSPATIKCLVSTNCIPKIRAHLKESFDAKILNLDDY